MAPGGRREVECSTADGWSLSTDHRRDRQFPPSAIQESSAHHRPDDGTHPTQRCDLVALAREQWLKSRCAAARISSAHQQRMTSPLFARPGGDLNDQGEAPSMLRSGVWSADRPTAEH